MLWAVSAGVVERQVSAQFGARVGAGLFVCAVFSARCLAARDSFWAQRLASDSQSPDYRTRDYDRRHDELLVDSLLDLPGERGLRGEN